MKPARLAVLGVAILSGGGAAMMMQGSEPPPPAPTPVAQAVKMSDVLVAAGDLPVGQTLRASDLRWQSWPADAVPAGYIIRSQNPGAIEETAGSIARSNFFNGDPIRREKLIKANGGGFMSALLPSGMRAVAISIDTRGATSAGGFILPNDRVDVLRTYRDDESSRLTGSDVFLSERILSNIRVLAIGQNIQEQTGGKVITAETATLELTPSQAEIITLGQKIGQLSLVLRSLADAERTEEIKEEHEASLTVLRYGVAKQLSKR